MTRPSYLAYLRFPHLHGELVTFAAEDDVWMAPLEGGGRAWRVSADNMPVDHPRISPDGELVAWTSTRDGAPEVLVAPVDGGPSRRLTYWGNARTSVRGWTPGGEVLAVSAHGQASSRWTPARALPVDGGPARTLPFGPVGSVAYGPDGAVLLTSAPMGPEAARWKRYRGGTAGKLWIDRTGEGEFERLLADVDGNIESVMWVGERIAFLSDHEGVGAVYSSLPDGSGLRRHTPAGDEGGFYARHATSDGARVVYASAGELWLLDDLAEGTEPRRLDIRLGGQRTDLQPHPLRATSWLGDARPDHTGRGSAVSVRGTTHWVTHRGGPSRALAAEPGVRTRLPRVFGGEGDQQVVWVTDAEGEDALEVAPAAGRAPGSAPRRLAAGRLGRVLGLAVSPDGHRIAVASHDGRVLLVETQTGEVREVARAEHDDATGLAFSPDSGWLAWSHPGPGQLRQIKLAATADLTAVDATPLRFHDTSPAFTSDGKHLAFLSERAFDPVYDEHVFDLSFVGTCRPHLITLAATTPSPFGPQRHGRPVDSSHEDKPDDTDQDEAGNDGKKDKAGEDKPRTPATRVDAEGLADRIVPFPVDAARYSTLRAAKDGVLWLRHPLRGVLGAGLATPDSDPPPTTLERYDLAQLRIEELADDVDDFAVSGDGNKVLVTSGGRLRVGSADHKSSPSDDESDSNVTVDLSRVRGTVDPQAEWRQMYAEAHRLMRDNFWRPDMGGVDWDAVADRYRPVLERVATHDDLVDLLWEVAGELGTSHAYVVPRGGYGDSLHRQGLLGADLERDGERDLERDGERGREAGEPAGDAAARWRIARVLPSESSDPRAHSPLAAPGVAVRPGDAILAVDGCPVDPVAGPGPLLIGTAGKPVELTVEPAGGGPVRHVVVVPISDEEPLRYHDWVAGRRRYVHERSEGRLGYLHVPDMVGAGWAQFHRDLRVEMAREGLVVDLRENGGGHTSQLVIEKLARRVVGGNLARGLPPMSYPLDAPRGPVVAVANEYAGSDGDIVTAVIKALGIGPVVGTRTWGGVIGIDSRYHLVDGTLVTQPKYAFWLEGYGWDLENYGVDPDVEVVHAPQDWAAGRDLQLTEAVRIALDGLAGHPAKVPPPLP